MNADGPLVLVYAQDAGGARAVSPVVKRLVRSRKHRLRVVAHLFAREVFQEQDIEAVHLDALADWLPLSVEGARGLLSRFSPDAMFCALSNNEYDPSNGRLVAAARELGIPSFALMDHWKGWGRVHGGEKDFAYLPDALGVIDEWSRERGMAEGIPPGRMTVVGHPRLDVLRSRKRRGAEEFRKARGVRKGDFVCALFTQPVFVRRGGRLAVRPFLEGERAGIVADALRCCEEKIRETGREAKFFVSLHPKEIEEWKADASPLPGATIDAGASSLEIACGSDLVLGFDSMILYEAMYCGRPTISLRLDSLSGVPGFFEDSPGVLQEARSLAEFAELLYSWLVKRELGALRRAPIDEPQLRSVDSCVGVLERMLQGEFARIRKAARAK